MEIRRAAEFGALESKSSLVVGWRGGGGLLGHGALVEAPDVGVGAGQLDVRRVDEREEELFADDSQLERGAGVARQSFAALAVRQHVLLARAKRRVEQASHQNIARTLSATEKQ